jgi:predicted TIM-barrel fold metal-dependent hydrolase
VMFHTAYGYGSEPERVARVAARFPSVPVVCYHCACGDFASPSIAAARANANLHLELSDATREAVERILAEAPADQIVFGSDDPLNIGIGMFERVWWATRRDPDLRRRVMGDTMARLIGAAG